MNKKTYYTLSLLLVLGFLLSACQLPFVDITIIRGSGELITESRAVEPFKEVQLDGAGRMIITQGAAESLEISAEDNIIGELTSQVVDDTLILGFKDQSWRRSVIPTEVIRYELTVTDLTRITLNGAGEITMEILETESLDIGINGAGRIAINELTVEENLNVKIIGAGTIALAGSAPNQTISIDGTGNIRAEDLLTKDTIIEIIGLGNGTVWVEDTLDVTIKGAGNVTYFGAPEVTQNITGAGDIDNRGEK